MREELTRRILALAPDIFPKDEQGRPIFFFDHGDGWYPLVYELVSFVAWKRLKPDKVRDGDYLRDPKPCPPDQVYHAGCERPWDHFRVVQVKQKFGELRFYYTGPPSFEEVVEYATAMSRRICEACGGWAVATRPPLNRGIWVATLCLRCHELRDSGLTTGSVMEQVRPDFPF
jgi:hypothetical protein